MRTKALLLTAILGVTGVVSTLAQSNVYSVNVVGYVTVTVTNDVNWRILANPLISTNNALTVLIPTAPNGTQVQQLVGAGYLISTYDADFASWDNELNLSVGSGFFIKLGASGSVPVTFVGEVAQDAASNSKIGSGLTLKGAMVPQKGSFQTVHMMPTGAPVGGNQVSILPPNGVYLTSTYDADFESWDNDFDIDVAEGFFYQNNGAELNWDRNFKVQ